MTSRTILVTGTASGINAAVRAELERGGHRVIGVDFADAEIAVDLATPEGRTEMVARARELSGGRLDGVVAGAGESRTDPGRLVSTNYFGAIATLEGLHPLLAASGIGRAVAIVSTASLLPVSAATVQACLAGDEPRAIEAARADPDNAYAAGKNALARWIRRHAVTPAWAGRGICLNGVAPGGVRTAMLDGIDESAEFQAIMATTTPKAVADYAQPEDLAEVIGWLVTARTGYVVGQVLFADGGCDAILRGEGYWQA